MSTRGFDGLEGDHVCNNISRMNVCRFQINDITIRGSNSKSKLHAETHQ